MSQLLLGVGREQPLVVAGAPGSSLLTALVAYWKLEEASGSRADALGGSPLTDNNTVTTAAGKQAQAALCTAANSEYLSLASNAAVQMGDIDFTVAAWVYLNSAKNMSLVAKDSNAASSRDYTLDYETAFTRFRFYINGSVIAAEAGGRSLATWYLVVGWHDATANTVNVQVNNGTVALANTGGAVPNLSSAEFRIGARFYAANEDYSDARIDEVGLWKAVLTPTQRTNLYAAGAGVTYPFTGVP
jgi:hypothetical protein